MSKKNCNCKCPELSMLPVRGFGLAVDASDFSCTDCRIRVSEDLHIYIDGKRTESGDGLTPETAVMSYEEALDAASRYDGCNQYALHVHFMDLPEGEAYPGVTVHSGHYATFARMLVSGESWERTHLQGLTLADGRLGVSNVASTSFRSHGTCWISENVGVMPQEAPGPAFDALDCGMIRLYSCSVHIEGGTYDSVLRASFNGSVLVDDNSKIIHKAPVSVTRAYATAWDGGDIGVYGGATINGTATGKRYQAYYGGVIATRRRGEEFFPGSVAGTTENGGWYY